MQNTNESANFLPLVRVEYVNHYVSVLREMGVPVARELRRARLPALIEDISNQYVSTNLAYKCLMRCIEAEGIDDLGFEVGWSLTFDDFSSDMKQALNSAPTLKYAIETFARLSPIEDSAVESALLFEGETVRIMIHQQVPPDTDRRLSDWPNIKMIIEIIRRHTGPHWLPALIGLKSHLTVCSRTRQALGDIKVLIDQSFCYVEIPVWILALPPIRSSFSAQGLQAARQSGNPLAQSQLDRDDPIDRLRAAIYPYLDSGYPPIGLAAEICGTSVRSLQRRLDAMQTSYSEMIETVRFERALYLLVNSQQRIQDVAKSLGYGDASNFARAIRRISGSSPRELRRQRQSGHD